MAPRPPGSATVARVWVYESDVNMDTIHNTIVFIDTSTMLYTTKLFVYWKAIFGDNC